MSQHLPYSRAQYIKVMSKWLIPSVSVRTVLAGHTSLMWIVLFRSILGPSTIMWVWWASIRHQRRKWIVRHPSASDSITHKLWYTKIVLAHFSCTPRSAGFNRQLRCATTFGHCTCHWECVAPTTAATANPQQLCQFTHCWLHVQFQ